MTLKNNGKRYIHIHKHTQEYRLERKEESTLHESPRLVIFHPDNDSSRDYYNEINLY